MSGETDPEDEKTVFRPAGGQHGAGQIPPAAPAQAGRMEQEQRAPYVPPAPEPVPGGIRQAESGSSSGSARLNFAVSEPDLYGPEPLVAAAGRLIHLASHIRTMPVGPDLGALRRLCIQELEAFAPRARQLGLEPKSVQLAHYILCAFIDDAVMSTPWGANSPWSQQSLLAAYHNDTQGGDRMFQFAERMEQNPDREPRLMELLYQCLSLGFEGRAALDPRGQSLLHQRRANLAAALGRQTGLPPADLSPQWKGQLAAAEPYAPRIPLWAVLSGIAALGLLIFAALLFRLSTQSDAAVAMLDQAVGGAEITPPPPPPESATPTFQRMQGILQPDISAGRLKLRREANEIVIQLRNQGLFASGQADPANNWSDTFERLAEAANLSKGPIKIEGHTDDQPIRSTLRYPSNQELSLARAEAVANTLGGAGLADSSRLSTEGFGDTRPVAGNGSEAGRRENRRVELRVANDIAWR